MQTLHETHTSVTFRGSEYEVVAKAVITNNNVTQGTYFTITKNPQMKRKFDVSFICIDVEIVQQVALSYIESLALAELRQLSPKSEVSMEYTLLETHTRVINDQRVIEYKVNYNQGMTIINGYEGPAFLGKMIFDEVIPQGKNLVQAVDSFHNKVTQFESLEDFLEFTNAETLRKINNLPEGKPTPTTSQPSTEEMMRWDFDGIAQATDGCNVEPDGVCEHGHKSWLLYKGLI